MQSPDQAECREMPESAIKYGGPIDLIAPIDMPSIEICKLTGNIPKPGGAAGQTA